MNADRGSFGELLRRLRTTAALSQQELAERAGLSKRGISDLERGVHQAPRLKTVRLLADALALGKADRQALLAAAPERRGRGMKRKPASAGAAQPAADAAPAAEAKAPAEKKKKKKKKKKKAAARKRTEATPAESGETADEPPAE